MAGEFTHRDISGDPRGRLTQADYESASHHVADGQLANDLLYYNGTAWVRATPATIAGILDIARPATKVVAANDADATVKLQADYVCDGTADDVQIQAAIDALPAGGGTVSLSEGIFNIAAAIKVKSYTTLEGQGDSTVIKQNTAANYDPITSGDYSSSGNGDYTILRNFKVDGNRSVVTGSGTIVWYGCARPIFDNLHIVDMYGSGILLRTCDNAIIKNCHVDNAQVDGITIYDGSDHCLIEGNVVENCDGAYGICILGYETTGQTFSLENIVSQNITKNNANAGIGIIAFAYRTIVIGNLSRGNVNGIYTYGDYIDSAERNVLDTLIIGNYCDYNTGVGIRIDGNGGANKAYTDDATIIGNFVHDNLTGIALSAQARTSSILNNKLRVNTTAVSDSGSSTVIRGNIGYVTENSGTAAVLNSTTSIVVNHGLATTPTRVQITPRENPTNAVAFWWVDTLTATQFTINVNADPGASGLDFDWHAQYGEG